MGPFQRVILIVLDSVGIGELPDSAELGQTIAENFGLRLAHGQSFLNPDLQFGKKYSAHTRSK